MAFPRGWDQRDRSTLRFLDPELERAYRQADQAQGVRRVRTTALVAAAVWVIVGLLGPPAIGVEPGPTWLIAGTMTAFLVACAIASRSAVPEPRQDAVGL